MTIQGIGGAGLAGLNGAGAPQKLGGEKFSGLVKGQTSGPTIAQPRGELAPLQAQSSRAGTTVPAEPGSAAGATGKKHRATGLEPAKMVDHLSAAQKRMDAVLELAQSGRSFTPAELLSLQTQMYRVSQELDLAGKVVEKATGGVKQILQTQV